MRTSTIPPHSWKHPTNVPIFLVPHGPSVFYFSNAHNWPKPCPLKLTHNVKYAVWPLFSRLCHLLNVFSSLFHEFALFSFLLNSESIFYWYIPADWRDLPAVYHWISERAKANSPKWNNKHRSPSPGLQKCPLTAHPHHSHPPQPLSSTGSNTQGPRPAPAPRTRCQPWAGRGRGHGAASCRPLPEQGEQKQALRAWSGA